jgi:hypothetical protein
MKFSQGTDSMQRRGDAEAEKRPKAEERKPEF